MDELEEKQMHIYDLREEKKRLNLTISEEQFANHCLRQKRSMLSATVVRYIILAAYFLFLYGGIRFLEEVNRAWDGARENPVIGKLLAMMDGTGAVLKVVLLLAAAVSVAFLIRQIYRIWLNSESPDALEYAKKNQKMTYSIQLADSDQRLAGLYYRMQEIDEELEQLEQVS